MEREKAFRLVFEELKQCNMFRGVYDARHDLRNRNDNIERFMFGVEAVMAGIASQISNEEYEKFEEMFFDNVDRSIKKARKRLQEEKAQKILQQKRDELSEKYEKD